MPYSISNHRLRRDGEAISFRRSPHHSRGFTPEGIVLHDTAGRLKKFNSVAWFENPAAKASAHFVVERDGAVTQLVPLDRKAWHAGKSRYKGRRNVNAFAFGIEIVNLGRCRKVGDKFKPWFNAAYGDGDDGSVFERAKSPEHGDGYWQDYTEAQISTTIDICSALVDRYNLAWITTHWAVSPHRKVDTNPLFPLDQVVSKVFGRGDRDHDDADAATIANVNLRRWPSYFDNVITVVPRGSGIEILRSGHFTNSGTGEELWHCVRFGDQEGWLNGKLVEIG